MLDIIRKKSADWGVKVIFGIIIIVFVFFFGYSRMSQRDKGARGGTVVARVNGEIITRPKFQLAYDNTYKMYQNIFKGKEGEPLPEGIQKSVTATTINQLIQQSIVDQLGNKIGVGPTDMELAEAIKNSPAAKDENGQFDPYMYKRRFLPYFSQKYNMDYENLLKEEIIIQNVQSVFKTEEKAPFAKPLFDMSNTKWTFDVTEFDNEDLAKAGKQGKTKKVGPVSISERSQIIPSDIDVEVWDKIFTLRTEKGAPAAPVQAGEKWYVVRPLKIDLPQEAQWQKDGETFQKTVATQNGQEFFQLWISSLMKDAKIHRYIEE
ncbi:MAG: hypothetical protein COV46_03680 [Deltaproteobacteria bacterium CG11_big_fil_rev_8_21_14_0_20_49_13]|nr:MAG: hypothetical protein COV46_03680 [Deltaproteobacteria bacterium CG11_big_fil_rev_8_21_14_0_20_49_13]